MQDIKEMGAGIVAVAPQLPHLNEEVKKKHSLTYPILTDNDNLFAKSLGLVHSLSSELAELYKGFGFNLPKNHGTSTWELPLAATIVVSGDGVVALVVADPDYTVRSEPVDTLEVLQRLKTRQK